MPTNKRDPFVAGYHTYWTEGAWSGYPFDILDQIYFFEVEMGGDGRIADTHGWPSRWQEMTSRAIDAGVQVVPTVSMHDPDAFEMLFSSKDRVSTAIETTMALLDETPGLSGIHLDFEVFRAVSKDAYDGFSAFAAGLADRMKGDHPRLSLSVFTLAFDDDDVYDERLLGQVADYLVIQGYDYHSTESENAGPVAALRGWGRLNWETVVARFEGFDVPRRKLVMGVPLYGYEWPVASATKGASARGPGVPAPYAPPASMLPDLPRARRQAEAHGLNRDDVSGSPWYAFQTADGWRQGWFEDAVSLRAKYDFVRAEGLGGIALFPLAYGDQALWADVRQVLGR